MSDTPLPFTAVTEATIIRLVDTFYARVRRDPTLGPVFGAAIAEDAWPAHLEKMYAFWSSVMLGSGRYKGNPVEVHERVNGLEASLFEHWLDLFEQTAIELFMPDLAELFAIKARRIAESLRLALFFCPGESRLPDLRKRNSLAGADIMR